MRELKDAMRQAASSLETLKLVKADQDPNIQRLLRELRAVSVEEPDRHTMIAD